MKYKRIALLIILTIFITACNKELTDSLKFKKEYEKYNNEKIELNISETNIIEYKTEEEINEIIKTKSGVIFIGTPKDNKSRISIKLLLDASESTDLQEIYYIDSVKNIKVENIDKSTVPIVLFILEGKVVDKYTLEKEKLTEGEEIDIYNNYLEGIHKVLQDTCDEEC